jgi:hypothetical protein
MVDQQPNAKFEHVYAIVRIDTDMLSSQSLDNAFTIVKALRKREDADKEIDRLNSVNAGKSCSYFVQLCRLEKQTQGT